MDISEYDTCFDLVSNEQRRRIIHRLRDEATGETAVEELVEHLHDDVSAPLTDEGSTRTHLSIQLIHNHLPKLSDYGVIHYDQEAQVVRYRPDERIETVLDALPAEATPVPSDS